MKIELRAWNGKKMIYGPTGGQVSPGWILVFCEAYKNRGIPDPMLYSGLRDKNGTKIFGGDIFKTVNNYIGEVVWQNGGFDAVIMEKGHLDVESLEYAVDAGIEIIGNIYESPELEGG